MNFCFSFTFKLDNIDEGKIDLVMKIAASCYLPLMFKVVILVVILVIKLLTLYADGYPLLKEK